MKPQPKSSTRAVPHPGDKERKQSTASGSSGKTPGRVKISSGRTPDTKVNSSDRKVKKGSSFLSLNVLFAVVFPLFVLYMTVFQYPDYLRKLADLDLFLMDRTFFTDSAARAGGLLMYAGSFLTQFFFIPWLGALLYLCMLGFVVFLAVKTFRLGKTGFGLGFLPAFFLLLIATQQGYLMYVQKIHGYVFTPVLGVLVSMLGLLAYRNCTKSAFRMYLPVVYLLTAFPVAGAYGVLGGLLLLVEQLKDFFPAKKKNGLPVVLTVLALTGIPFGYYWFLYDHQSLDWFYLATVPHFLAKQSLQMLWLPYTKIVGVLILLVFWKTTEAALLKNRWFRIVPPVLFFLALIAVYGFSFKDQNFYAEIAMQEAIEDENWQEVLRIGQQTKDEPTRLMVMQSQLALFNLDQAGDKFYQIRNGSKKPAYNTLITPAQIAGPMYYFNSGMLNYCNKWCMETSVENGLSVYRLRYFVLSSLLNGELALARKYNDLLHSTLFFRKWAEEMDQYINNPVKIKQNPRFKNIIDLKLYDDLLDGDYGDMEGCLRNHFSTMREVSPRLATYSVLYNLDIKNIERFWPRLFYWVRLHPNQHIPVAFQEAALLFSSLDKKMDISGAPFDKAVMDNFQNFQAMVNQYGSNSPENLSKILAQPFGNTYWYYYFYFTDTSERKKDDNSYLK